MSFFGNLVGAAPYLAPVLEQKRLRGVQEQIQKDTAARQQAADARAEALSRAQIDNIRSEIDARNRPPAPKPIFDQEGNAWRIGDDGRTLERIQPHDASSPSVSLPSSPSAPQKLFDMSPDAITGALRGSIGLRPTEPMSEQPTTSAPAPFSERPLPQTPSVTVQQDTTPKFGKAPAPDPTKVHAANRAFDIAHPLPTAASARIDPNSPAGIAADSTKAANRVLFRPAGGMTGGMGSGGIGGVARTSAGITGMENAHTSMLPFEQAVRSGKASFDGLDYYQTQLAKMFDAHGNLDRAVHAAAFAHLNKTNPALANYLGSVEQWALEDATVSGRPSDFRTKMDGFISMIGPNPNPQNIDRVVNFRQTRIDELKKFQPALQGIANRFTQQNSGGRGTPPPNARGTAPPAGTPGNINLGKITPEERAALKQSGFTDAQITAKYGPP